MALSEKQKQQYEKRHAGIIESFNRHGGNISAVSREMKIGRTTVQEHVRKAGWAAKPLVMGQIARTEAEVLDMPPKGRIRRYLLTSAQNNTHVNEAMWKSLNTLASHYDAAIMVGTFSYNTNAYGKLSVKRGKEHVKQTELWYDARLTEHIVDTRVEIAKGLVWAGEMNILPTATNPLSGLETYSHRRSAIFPHAKLAMKSVAAMQGEGAKMNYTTGTVTVHNYIQKREGLIAEHHHAYAALLVEVNDEGNWWVRQVHCDDKGRMQDLDIIADGSKIITNAPIEAVTWGDLHATHVDPEVVESAMTLLDELKPKYQFFHDVLEGASINHHESLSPHRKFDTWMRGMHRVEAEMQQTNFILGRYVRPGTEMIAADSNHDTAWLYRWLKEYDYRKDPANAEFFLRMQTYMYAEVRGRKMVRDINLLEWALNNVEPKAPHMLFLNPDESFTIAGNRIECGMHGHFGPDGARGTPMNLNKVGRRANTGHTHSAGIYNGLYVAGTSSKLRWDYTKGPSSWSHSHILTYPNGARTIITMYAGKWKA